MFNQLIISTKIQFAKLTYGKLYHEFESRSFRADNQIIKMVELKKFNLFFS